MQRSTLDEADFTGGRERLSERTYPGGKGYQSNHAEPFSSTVFSYCSKVAGWWGKNIGL